MKSDICFRISKFFEIDFVIKNTLWKNENRNKFSYLFTKTVSLIFKSIRFENLYSVLHLLPKSPWCIACGIEIFRKISPVRQLVLFVLFLKSSDILRRCFWSAIPQRECHLRYSLTRGTLFRYSCFLFSTRVFGKLLLLELLKYEIN